MYLEIGLIISRVWLDHIAIKLSTNTIYKMCGIGIVAVYTGVGRK